MNTVAFSCEYMSLRCGGHYWILTKPPSGLCFLLTNPVLVQRGGGSILREGESLLSPRGQFVSVLTQWEYPFLSVVIALRKSYDIVVATEEQKRKEVRWGASGKDFPSSRKERYMREALSSSILLAFWLCCLRLWGLELRQLFCYHEEHVMTYQTCQQQDEESLEPKWHHWAAGLKVLDGGQIRLHAGCLLEVILQDTQTALSRLMPSTLFMEEYLSL